jgi:hypothetical protein
MTVRKEAKMGIFAGLKKRISVDRIDSVPAKKLNSVYMGESDHNGIVSLGVEISRLGGVWQTDGHVGHWRNILSRDKTDYEECFSLDSASWAVMEDNATGKRKLLVATGTKLRNLI